MAGTGIRTIIFDIGRVLVRVDVARAKAGLAKGLALSPEELWSAIEKDPRWGDWQEGRMSARDWYLNLSSRLGIARFRAIHGRLEQHPRSRANSSHPVF